MNAASVQLFGAALDASDFARVSGNPDVISSPVGLVPRNALVLTGLANFRVVG